MYLLDTTHCIKILSGDNELERKFEMLGNAHISTCVTVVGELAYGAHKSDRTRENLEAIAELLRDMHVVYGIEVKTAEIYGRLKAEILDYFGPKDRVRRRIIRTEKLGFRENDLWIASIAKQYDLTIVSADSDFQRLQPIMGLKVETW
ncbi:type II toxin-antitoxin system VapC family toxin [Candidatus Poribacteria bacterium]